MMPDRGLSAQDIGTDENDLVAFFFSILSGKRPGSVDPGQFPVSTLPLRAYFHMSLNARRTSAIPGKLRPGHQASVCVEQAYLDLEQTGKIE